MVDPVAKLASVLFELFPSRAAWHSRKDSFFEKMRTSQNEARKQVLASLLSMAFVTALKTEDQQSEELEWSKEDLLDNVARAIWLVWRNHIADISGVVTEHNMEALMDILKPVVQETLDEDEYFETDDETDDYETTAQQKPGAKRLRDDA